MKRLRARRVRSEAPAELEITTFMNLMVVLVPFLLVMAVFSRVTILELNLPSGSEAAAQPETPKLVLEVIVRADRIELADRNSGLIRSIGKQAGGHDLKQLAEVLGQVKARFPDVTEATILLEPNIAYEDLVDVMDAVRTLPVKQAGGMVAAELFPDISIGDAPRGGAS